MECAGCAQAYLMSQRATLRFNLIACGAFAKKGFFVFLFGVYLLLLLRGLIKL